jgi:DNA-binding response OmpR family regulator
VLDGRRVPLSPLEFGVFDCLSAQTGNAVSRATLIEEVWGHKYLGGSNVVDVVIRSLRKKLGDDGPTIETVRGLGYRLKT